MTVDDVASEQEPVDEDVRDRADQPFDVPVLPLKDTVVYPLTVVPLGVGQERSLRLVDDVAARDRLIGLVAQRQAETQLAGPGDVFEVGTLGKIHQLLKMPDGTIRLVMQGLQRIRILEYTQEQPYLAAKVQAMPESEEDNVEVEAMARNVVSLFQQLVNLSPYLPDELVAAAMNVEGPRQLAYFVAMNLRLELEQRQEFLEIDSVAQKLRILTTYLNKELEVLELGRKIQSEAQEQMTKAQRDYYLREQLKAIQKQLGEESPEEAEIRDLREKVEKSGMPEEARREAERELSRLEKIPSASPEHGVIRNYLDWLTALPWTVSTGKTIDVAEARRILDEDHYDLEKVKDRILEYLAVRKLREERQGEDGVDAAAMKEPILCFVGPPGVGKTSLGQSIARAMGRKFIRQSLGGVRDEAEIRGHRRTYIGAMPGRILQAIRRAESNDPVFMMDEVDKIGADWRGDPSSALLEVLDPEQNKDFRDHYVDVPFDLSKVMFITTANTLETIPPPLRDRMEILQLSGYTEEEKVQIAKRYIVAKQMKAHGLKIDEVTIEDEALRTIVRDYTREAGVRNLEREVATVYRKAAREIAEGVAAAVVVTPEKVREYLGRPRHFAEVAERVDRPGVVTGLVWTPVGGEIVFVEAVAMPGNKGLRLTGQLGDVMKESAEAAYSCVRSRVAQLGVPADFFDKHEVHIHVPAGAQPKDGPSAGVTMATALASIVTGRSVRHDVAMTGEITLLGKVLPIGGLKEKVLGAHRAGITTIILPKRNEADLEDLPPELRERMEFVPVESIDEVLDRALVPVAGVEVRQQVEAAS
ncbi:MAG: endopeptidase La [Sphingomonadaceae bacterium]